MADLALDTRLGIGGNQAPEHEIARERVDTLIAAAERWAKERPELLEAETAARATDFIEQLSAETRKIEAARKAEKAPLNEAAKAVDRRWNPLVITLDACKALMTARRSSWLKREDARL